MFMICSNVVNRSVDVKPQGNGVMRDERTPSLDVGDVKDTHSHRQHGGQPYESRIGGLIHDDSWPYKSWARTLAPSLNLPRNPPINSNRPLEIPDLFLRL